MILRGREEFHLDSNRVVSDDRPCIFHSVDFGLMHVLILKGQMSRGVISQKVHGLLIVRRNGFFK